VIQEPQRLLLILELLLQFILSVVQLQKLMIMIRVHPARLKRPVFALLKVRFWDEQVLIEVLLIYVAPLPQLVRLFLEEVLALQVFELVLLLLAVHQSGRGASAQGNLLLLASG